MSDMNVEQQLPVVHCGRLPGLFPGQTFLVVLDPVFLMARAAAAATHAAYGRPRPGGKLSSPLDWTPTLDEVLARPAITVDELGGPREFTQAGMEVFAPNLPAGLRLA